MAKMIHNVETSISKNNGVTTDESGQKNNVVETTTYIDNNKPSQTYSRDGSAEEMTYYLQKSKCAGISLMLVRIVVFPFHDNANEKSGECSLTLGTRYSSSYKCAG